jgi:hypothetical protein
MASPRLGASSELRAVSSEMGSNALDSEIDVSRRPTSAELNRKEPLGYSVGFESEGEEEGGEGSQIFPGSGLF